MSDQIFENTEPAGSPSYETFEDFLASADEPVKSLYKKHTDGLNSALEKERAGRKDLEKQLKELLPKAEKGSALELELAEKVRLLEETDKKYAEVERRAKFAEEAGQPNIRCVNVKAAYALATVENMFKEDGSPMWDAIRKTAPELFKLGSTDAGSTGKRALDNDINSALRSAAFGR